MKKLAMLVCAAVVMSASVPAFAEQMTKDQKNECLLASKGCANEVDTIQQKMRKLDREIKKGTKVYTPEELQVLKAKLEETNKMLDNLLRAD